LISVRGRFVVPELFIATRATRTHQVKAGPDGKEEQQKHDRRHRASSPVPTECVTSEEVKRSKGDKHEGCYHQANSKELAAPECWKNRW